MLPQVPEPSTLPAGIAHQWVIFLTAFLVKPLYMVLSLVLAIALRRSRERALVLLRVALLFFFVGESLCAANYLFASGRSNLLEIGHQAGMIGMSLFLPWGIIVLLDLRALRFSDSSIPCALIPLCRHCWKREPVPCGVHRLFMYSLPMLAVLALMPITAPLEPLRIIVPVFGSPVAYEINATIQTLEFRLYPALAVLFMLGAWAVLLGGAARIRTAEPLFFAGFGFLSFALLRFFLFRSFLPYLSLSGAWEELTELFTIITVGLLLWIYRNPLGLTRS